MLRRRGGLRGEKWVRVKARYLLGPLGSGGRRRLRATTLLRRQLALKRTRVTGVEFTDDRTVWSTWRRRMSALLLGLPAPGAAGLRPPRPDVAASRLRRYGGDAALSAAAHRPPRLRRCARRARAMGRPRRPLHARLRGPGFHFLSLTHRRFLSTASPSSTRPATLDEASSASLQQGGRPTRVRPTTFVDRSGKLAY